MAPGAWGRKTPRKLWRNNRAAGLEKAGGEAGWKVGARLAGRGRGSHVRPRGEAPAGPERMEPGNWRRQELSLSGTERLDAAGTP